MKELLEEKELLEKRLSNINKEIEKEQSQIELNKTINSKTKEVQNLLTGDLLIKVHYLEKENKILITEYFEEEYVAFPYYDEEYEIILYQQTFKTLYDTITMLNKMIKEAKILKNKLNLIKVLRTEYKYEYNFHNFEINNIMQITHKDSILATLPESFDTELYTFICFNKNNKLDLAITTKIKYSHDIDISTTKLIDKIMTQILENKEPDTSIETEVQWYLEENDYLTYHEVFDQIVYDYADKNELDFDEVQEDLEQLLYDNVDYESNVDTLLRNSSPDDLHILFGDNWDDVYFEMEKWNEYKSYLEDHETTQDELNEVLSKTELGWLLETQGYKPYDVFKNHNKKLGNKFLDQVYSELFEYITSLEGMQLTASLESDNCDAIVAIHERKPFTIKAGSAFGLFNCVHGSGAGFEIELEKDIIVKDKDYEYRIAKSASPYDYSPAYVYGGNTANGHDNLTIA